jgi:hypothetical protein
MKTNNLKYTRAKNGVKLDGERVDIIVNICLNDECKNGHQDFAITGEIYEAGERGDRAMISAGCCHDAILKIFPEYKIFVDLHLSDYSGAPMYAAGNGFYHLKTGFNNVGPSAGELFDVKFIEYYRLTEEQYDIIKVAEDERHFAILLVESGVIDSWKSQAEKGIALLEQLTGDKFLNDSKRSHFVAPTEADMETHKQRLESGYYTKEAKLARDKEAARIKEQKHIAQIRENARKKIEALELDDRVHIWFFRYMKRLASKKLLVTKGFVLDQYFDDMIYYKHTNKITFNWKSFGRLQMDERCFDIFCENLTERDFQHLPNGISFELKGVKTFTK